MHIQKLVAVISANTEELEKVRGMVARGKLKGIGEIGLRVGKVVNKYKVAKHFELTITNNSFDFALRRSQIAAEAALDGIYVIRMGIPKRTMSSGDVVRKYKALSSVDGSFG